ncbi:MAG: glycosyltransferase family 2 protein [Kofleriaceae bacterium]|nr:glycosyltransferase family 2 protein [Myxococcales bacterium]MCB9565274.1 glycosyltransferase family 2 protein [Kofleriaceae bacterium]
MDIAARVVLVMDGLVVTYLVVFFAINFWFVALSANRVRRLLFRDQIRPPMTDAHSAFLPPLTLLVPAYNEEVTCIESVKSLLRLDYPSYEVIICNDGSKDRTVEVLRAAFGFERTDVNYDPVLATAPVRGLYQATCALPANVKRLVLIDKANGGKADALNAAINAAEGVFVSSMDADSVLEPDALLRAMQVVADDPSHTIAVGTQVGLSNGSVIENGEVKELRLPPTWIARFQVAEYMRSFTQGRTALARLNSILILSGVFALMRRDLVISAGGFLTKHVRGRVVEEYCGAGAHTVCEDMEVVVRLHRYLLDRGRVGVVNFLPHPAAWTEAPEVYRDLGKQRGRWYRGLLEVLWYHRAMMFRPRYRRIGMFSLPYQLIFEAAAPIVEALGYVMVPFTLAFGLLSPLHALTFLVLATALNVFLTTASVVLSVKTQRIGLGKDRALFAYGKARDTLTLLFSGFVANFGYRQYLVWWQLKGLRDFLKGRKDWDKFARKGFAGTVAK